MTTKKRQKSSDLIMTTDALSNDFESNNTLYPITLLPSSNFASCNAMSSFSSGTG